VRWNLDRVIDRGRQIEPGGTFGHVFRDDGIGP
jgi:hypothetical protein